MNLEINKITDLEELEALKCYLYAEKACTNDFDEECEIHSEIQSVEFRISELKGEFNEDIT